MSDDDSGEYKLPPLIEGLLSGVEHLARDKVQMLFVSTRQVRPCQFCTLNTKLRLQVKSTEDEEGVQVLTICADCRQRIVDAPVA